MIEIQSIKNVKQSNKKTDKIVMIKQKAQNRKMVKNEKNLDDFFQNKKMLKFYYCCRW